MKLEPFIMAAALMFFAVPSLANASSSLSTAQASAIVGLIQAFGADASVVLQVQQILGLAPATTPTTPPLTDDPSPPQYLPVIGSVYRASNLGFDYSYNAPLFPPTNFGFGLVGVTGGKSFTQNPRVGQEFNWARFGSGAPPTLYMNLNAPYGNAAAANVSSPKACSPTMVGTTSEPTACAGYNYGYNAAKYAFAYAQTSGVTSSIWWLDIETANSWSPDTTVNNAAIQGAIDYLNAQNIRAGIYSMTTMWNEIMGSTFAPAQTIGGQPISIPTWLPIGIDTQIGALNSCVTERSFLPNSSIWLIQYVANSSAVDQNIAC